MPGFGGILMKRLVYYATIGLVGVLAAVAVKLPVVREVLLPGDTHVLSESGYFLDCGSELVPLRPLIINRGAPSLPSSVSEDFTLDGFTSLSLSSELMLSRLDAMNESGDCHLRMEMDSPGVEPADFEHVSVGKADDLILPGDESGAGTIDTDTCDNIKTGFILLDGAMKRHPLWMEVLRIEREMESCKSRWQSYVDASGITEEDVLKCLGVAEQVLDQVVSEELIEDFDFPDYSSALEFSLGLVEVSLIEEANARIQAKTVELQASLEDRLYAEKARLNNEFDEFKDKVIKESYITVINTQMKLRLVKLSDARRTELEEELQRLNEDIEKKLSVKQKELDDVYQLFETKEMTETETELAGYRKEQTNWVSTRLQEERERLTKEVEGFFADIRRANSGELESLQERVSRRGRIELSNRRAEMSKEFKEREAEFSEEFRELSVCRDEALDRIRKDVYQIVSDLENDLGIPIEVLECDSGPEEVDSYDTDVTPDVISSIRNCE